MDRFQENFTGHVTINGRIYEIFLVNIAEKNEKLFINGHEFKEFDQGLNQNWLSRRSVCIENCLLHFSYLKGVISIYVESPEDKWTPDEEKMGIPQFTVRSEIRSSELYSLDEVAKDETIRKNLLKNGKKIFTSLVFLCWLYCVYTGEMASTFFYIITFFVLLICVLYTA